MECMEERLTLTEDRVSSLINMQNILLKNQNLKESEN